MAQNLLHSSGSINLVRSGGTPNVPYRDVDIAVGASKQLLLIGQVAGVVADLRLYLGSKDPAGFSFEELTKTGLLPGGFVFAIHPPFADTVAIGFDLVGFVSNSASLSYSLYGL